MWPPLVAVLVVVHVAVACWTSANALEATSMESNTAVFMGINMKMIASLARAGLMDIIPINFLRGMNESLSIQKR